MASTRATRRNPLRAWLRLLGCAPADPGGGGCGPARRRPWSAAARCRWQVPTTAPLALLDAPPCGDWRCLATTRRLLHYAGRCFPTSTMMIRGFPLGAGGPLRRSAPPSPVSSASAVFGVLVLGRGEILTRRWPVLTTATPEGVVTSMGALSWPGLDPLLKHRGKSLVLHWTRQRRRLIAVPFLKALLGSHLESPTLQLEMVASPVFPPRLAGIMML